MSKAAAGKAVAAAVAGAGGAASGIVRADNQAARADTPPVQKGIAKLVVAAGEAKPGPAIGQALGPLGLNMAEFCKRFNADTAKMVPGTPTPVKLTAYKDRTFDFSKKTPPTSWLLKKAAGIELGSGAAGLDVAGMVTHKQIYEIAQIKKTDPHLAHLSLEQLCRSIVGSAKSCGIDVVAGEQPDKKR